jgi:ABC-type transport system substrate-binding protein
MEEAGYGDGFSIQLDCPNDRYINDEAICQAAVGMLAQIGITANLSALPRAQHFPLIANLETDFYMLGWGVPTYDAEYVFNFLISGRNGFDPLRLSAFPPGPATLPMAAIGGRAGGRRTVLRNRRSLQRRRGLARVVGSAAQGASGQGCLG